jgi:hypothetical protein
LSDSSTFQRYRSLREKLSWAAKTRPDISCAIAQAAQVTGGMYATEPLKYIKGLNAVVKHLRKTASFTLKYPKLDINSLTLKVITDASFAHNYDGSSQLGYIIFLADASGKCQQIVWSFHNTRRVTRSVLGSETVAFADGFDAAYSLKHDLQTILKRSVDILMYTDSLSLFDVITKSSTTAEKRLTIDLVVVREAFDRMEIAHLAFLRTNWNTADALSKVSRNNYLETILTTGTIDHPVAQWVVRRHLLAHRKGSECRNAPLLTSVTSTADESTSFV